jgi:hypothetical protein
VKFSPYMKVVYNIAALIALILKVLLSACLSSHVHLNYFYFPLSVHSVILSLVLPHTNINFERN